MLHITNFLKGYARVKKNKVIACMGDSITAFIQYSIPACKDSQHWTRLLALQLGASVKNFGVSGDTTEQQLARFSDVLAVSPTHCIIEEACNDPIHGIDPDQTLWNQISMITQCKNHNIVPIIMCSTPQFEHQFWYDSHPTIRPVVDWEAQLQQTRTLQRNYCLQNGIVYLDVYTPLLKNGGNNLDYYVADRVHPNVWGYRKIAEVASNGIAPLL